MASTGAPWPAAVAVSGGSDSLALMYLLRDWAEARALPPPVVVTIDHGLRSESAAEARKVLRWAKKAGLEAHILSAAAPPPAADIEAFARRLRYRLIGAFCRKKNLAAVYVAHTRDDQAETILMRLARGSGVDGLAGMRALAPFPDPQFAAVAVVRPLLGIDRCALRHLLLSRQQTWIEDPMNADARFARVRVRLAWPQLAPLGLTPERLAETAVHLGRAREALELVSHAVLTRVCLPYGGGFAVDPVALASAPAELGLRTLAKLLMIVSRNPYRPRFDRLKGLLTAITENSLGGGRTLHSCRIGPAPKAARLFGPGTLLIEVEKGRRGPRKSRFEAE